MKFILNIVFVLLFSQHLCAEIKVAITIDDLPTHGQLPNNMTFLEVVQSMVTTLKKHQVPDAHAFINGGKVINDPSLMKVLEIWKESQFSVGNHAYLHEDLHQTSIEDFKLAIDKNEPLLKKLNSNKEWKFFRYPYLREGDHLTKRNSIREYLKQKDYKIAQVTIDFEDWSWNNPYARCFDQKDQKSIDWLKKSYLQNAVDQLLRADQISKKLFKRSIPHILLLHSGAFDALVFDELLKSYKDKGVRFVTLSEALKDPVYSIDPGSADKWGSELTFQIMRSRNLSLKDLGLMPYKNYPATQLESVCI